MANTKYTENKFDEYLNEIRDREKVSHRRRLMKVGIILAILITGFMLFQKYTQGPVKSTWKTIAHEDLDNNRVSDILGEESRGFVITHHLLGWDTIRSLADYKRFRELVELIEITEEDVEGEKAIEGDDFEFASLAGTESGSSIEKGRLKMTQDATLEPFAIRINGPTYAGENIKFTVVNYDPGVKYTIDFGNGVTRKIQRSTIYSYPLNGNHIVRLIASSKDMGSSVYTKKIAILPPLNQAIASRKGNKNDNKINKLSNGLDLNEINRVTAFTVPRSSSGPNPAAEEKKEPKEEASELPEISVVDLGKLEQKESVATKNKPEAVVDKPLVYAEKMPSFPGGSDALKSYLRKHLKYPQEALKAKVQGQVIIQFIIEANGTITAPKVLKGIGSGCDEEALRIVDEMPAWLPGESNGLRVPVYQSIPISFRLFD